MNGKYGVDHEGNRESFFNGSFFSDAPFESGRCRGKNRAVDRSRVFFLRRQ